jgi:hypothetical protein
MRSRLPRQKQRRRETRPHVRSDPKAIRRLDWPQRRASGPRTCGPACFLQVLYSIVPDMRQPTGSIDNSLADSSSTGDTRLRGTRPGTETALLISSRRRLGNIAGSFDEELGDRTKGSIFQRHEADRSARRRQINGQYLDRLARAVFHCGSLHDADKAAARQQCVSQWRNRTQHRRAGKAEPMGIKCLGDDGAVKAVRRWKRPYCVLQLGELDFSPPAPRTSRAGDDDGRETRAFGV